MFNSVGIFVVMVCYTLRWIAYICLFSLCCACCLVACMLVRCLDGVSFIVAVCMGVPLRLGFWFAMRVFWRLCLLAVWVVCWFGFVVSILGFACFVLGLRCVCDDCLVLMVCGFAGVVVFAVVSIVFGLMGWVFGGC